jgi:hypothetical protein
MSFGIAGGEKMRITSGGNVLIGTTTDSGYKLDVNGTGRFSGKIAIGNISNAALQIYKSGYTGNQFQTYAELSAAPTVLSYTTSDGMGLILNMYEAVAGNPYTRYADIVANTGDVSDSVMRFFTKPYSGNAAERMRITSGGKVNIGNDTSTNSSYVLSINSTTADSQLLISGTAPMVRFGNAVTGSTNTALFGMATAANNYVTGTAAGDFVITSATSSSKIWVQAVSAGVYLSAGSTSWTANSDIRLKDINGYITNAIEKLSTLSTINFSWKDDATKKQNLGLIAQEVKAIFPELIEETSNGILGVRYTELVPVLIAAVKELKQELETIKNK